MPGSLTRPGIFSIEGSGLRRPAPEIPSARIKRALGVKMILSSERCGLRRCYSSNRLSTRQAFCPPSPNELDMVTCTSASRATLGT